MGRVRLRKNKIVLASASPRRRGLLAPFYRLKIAPADCDETQKPRELAIRYVQRVAFEKWKTVARKSRRDDVVVAADTTVILGDAIFGKPQNRVDARAILKRLSGKTHQVATAVVVGKPGVRPVKKLVTAKVTFREIQDSELSDYLRTGDWRDKAGAYAVQGGALSFVAEIRGSLTTIIGLPLAETLRLIEQSLAR